MFGKVKNINFYFLFTKMKLTKKEINKICEEFNLGKVINYKIIIGGVGNFNFLVKTDKGKYIIRIPSNDDEVWIEKTCDIMFRLLRYLKNKKFPYKIPEPVKNKKGFYLQKINKKYIWVYEYLEGKVCKRVNSKQFKEIAKASAMFYRYSKNFNYKKKKNKDLYQWMLKDFEKIKKNKPQDNVSKFVLKNLEFVEDLLKKLSKYNLENKITIVHADFHQENVIFEGNKIVGIIDFDDLGWHSRAKELMVSIRRTNYLKGRRFTQKKKDIFLKEYEKYEKIPKKEKNLIVPWLIYDYCIVFWWFYFEMKKQKHKRFIWIKEVIRDAKRDEKLLK